MLARCLTSPSRLVPVGVIGRRASYSLRPSTFQTIASRADCRYSMSVSLGSVIASSSPRRTDARLVPPVAGYTLVATTPPVDDYLGCGPIRPHAATTAQAVPALEGTWWGCHVIHDETGDVVAMGRVIGRRRLVLPRRRHGDAARAPARGSATWSSGRSSSTVRVIAGPALVRVPRLPSWPGCVSPLRTTTTARSSLSTMPAARRCHARTGQWQGAAVRRDERYGPWAVIAGGSEGVGRAFATQLAEAGLNLVLIARKPVALEETAALCRAHGVEVRPLALDLTAPDSVARVIDEVEDVEVGLLVYNAGANTHSEEFLDGDLVEFQQVIDLNITTPWPWSTTSARAMRDRGRGGILLVGSKASSVGLGAAHRLRRGEGVRADLRRGSVGRAARARRRRARAGPRGDQDAGDGAGRPQPGRARGSRRPTRRTSPVRAWPGSPTAPCGRRASGTQRSRADVVLGTHRMMQKLWGRRTTSDHGRGTARAARGPGAAGWRTSWRSPAWWRRTARWSTPARRRRWPGCGPTTVRTTWRAGR